jgi:hypothetical protein
MTRIPLSRTLTALIEGATPHHPGLAVEEAEIRLPLLLRMERGPDGPVFSAQPPHSPFRQGVEPVFHHARIRIEAATETPAVAPATSPAPETGE